MAIRLRRTAGALVLLAGVGWSTIRLSAPARAEDRQTIELAAPAEDPLPDEAELLRRAARYFDLSRALLSRLQLAAVYVDREHRRLLYEERRALAKLDPEAPEAADGPTSQRKEAETALVRWGNAQLVRLLSREQILLAWRLRQGSPPKYAGLDPVLLRPEAGFVAGTPRQKTILGAPQILRGEDRGAQEQAPDRLSLPRLTRNFDHLIVGSRRGDPRTTVKPFPQMVVESANVDELAAELEPFAKRLLLSEGLLPFLKDALTKGIGPVAATRRAPPSSRTTRVIRDYRLYQDFRDLTGKGPRVEPLGGEVAQGFYQFGPGQGMVLPDAGVTDQYALDVTFQFFRGDGYQKVVDYKDGRQDDGLYLYQGHITFYRLADGGAPRPGQVHRLRVERNRSSRVVRAWLDGRPIFAFMDLDDEAVFDGRKCVLFVDDKQTKREQGPGLLRSVTVWGPP